MIRLEEVWQAMPAGTYAIAGLMRVVDIGESAEVETAAMLYKPVPRILINPDFAKRFAPTPERQAALILHELLHLLLGHQAKPMTRMDNFVLDAVINAMICHMTGSPAYWSLFTSTYSSRRFPECLLRPPAGFRAGGGSCLKIPRVLKGDRMRHVRSAYRDLYSNWGTSYKDIRRQFRMPEDYYPELWRGWTVEEVEASAEIAGENLCWPGDDDSDWEDGGEAQAWEEPCELPPQAASLDAVPLLGSHPVNPEPDLTGAGWLRSLASMVQALQQKWIRGRSLSEELTVMKFDLSALDRRANVAALKRLISRVALDGATRTGESGTIRSRVLTALPALDRRSTVLRFLGLQPLLHAWETETPQPRHIDPVHVYVDVSGSVAEFVGCLCQAVLSCRHLAHRQIHLFSTEVADVDVDTLSHGHVPTTGGTDIGCVLEHMKRRKITRAVLLTDGYVGSPAEEFHSYLRRCSLAVALTPGGSLVSLKDFVRCHVRLFRD